MLPFLLSTTIYSNAYFYFHSSTQLAHGCHTVAAVVKQTHVSPLLTWRSHSINVVAGSAPLSITCAGRSPQPWMSIAWSSTLLLGLCPPIWPEPSEAMLESANWRTAIPSSMLARNSSHTVVWSSGRSWLSLCVTVSGFKLASFQPASSERMYALSLKIIQKSLGADDKRNCSWVDQSGLQISWMLL